MPEDRLTGRSPAEKVRNYYEGIRWVHERFRVFHDLPQPIVVRRAGVLPRLRLRARADARHPAAADDVLFALPEAQVGVSIDAGGDLRLAREIGAGQAKLLSLTGRRITPAEAERLGDGSAGRPARSSTRRPCSIACEIPASNAPLAVQGIKRTINEYADRRARRRPALRGAVSVDSSSSPTTCPRGMRRRPPTRRTRNSRANDHVYFLPRRQDAGAPDAP